MIAKEIEAGGRIVSFMPGNRKMFLIKTRKLQIETDKLIENLLNRRILSKFDQEKLKNIYNNFF